jgi:hypothetical protein
VSVVEENQVLRSFTPTTETRRWGLPGAQEDKRAREDKAISKRSEGPAPTYEGDFVVEGICCWSAGGRWRILRCITRCMGG